MGSSGFGSIIPLFYALLVLQCFWSTSSRKINEKIPFATVENLQRSAKKENDHGQKGCHEVQVQEHVHHHSLSHSHMDPSNPEFQIFFTFNSLKIGKKMAIYFPLKDPSSSPPLLSRDKADSVPFSSSQLPKLLEFFSFSDGSPQAKAMEDTLRHCETEPVEGESKFCATSLESMLDSARGIFGQNVPFKVLTTNLLTKITSPLQNYTIVHIPKEISARRIIGCHPLPYPYAVFYCHSQESDNKLFKVSLIGENGGRVEAVAMCHMDTSQWNRDHVAFLVLKTEPGRSPVCHFFPADNLVWIPSSSVSM